MFTHTNGPYRVENGALLLPTGNMINDNISVCLSVDTEDGHIMLHKIGTTESVKKYHQNTVRKLLQAGLTDMANEYKCISFHIQYPNLAFTPDGYNFTMDDVCTLINWWVNYPNDNGSEILNMPLDEIRAKIQKLAIAGY